MEAAEAWEFCDAWLGAWSGADDAKLAAFYAPTAFYRDPAFPGGIRDHAALQRYFAKLLRAYPGWKWQAVEVFPNPAGFTLKWRATIPAGAANIVEYGMDIVECAGRLITRNEVYFDRAALAAITGKQ